MNKKTILRQARELRGWSQAKVAKEVDADIGTVSRWERGISTPSPYFRERLCQIFEMDAQALGFLEVEDQEEYTLFAQDQISSLLPNTKDAAIVYHPLIPHFASTNFVLVGRDTLLNNIIPYIFEGGICSIFGLPGVGKTTLAIALVQHETIRLQFPDGILWARLGPAPDLRSLLNHWGMLLGFPTSASDQETTKNLSHILHQRLGQRRFLLILDDVWTNEALTPLLIGGPKCAYLVTTRFPKLAHIATTGASISVPILSDNDSFELLKAIEPSIVQVDYTLIHSVIQLTGGLPLALTLIGKHLQIASRSGQPRRLLSTLKRFTERSARLQLTFPVFPAEYSSTTNKSSVHSLEEMIASIDHILSSHAQAALHLLPLLPTRPDSFSESAALAIINTTVEVLDELVDKGMIESHSPDHYTIHQLIHDYCCHHYQPTLDARKRLVEYGVRYVERYCKDFSLLTLELPVILLALEEACLLEQRRELVRGVYEIADFFCIQKLYGLAEHHFARAYTAATEIADFKHKMYILFYQGEIASLQQDYTQACACYEEAFLLAQQTQDGAWQRKLRQHLSKVQSQVFRTRVQLMNFQDDIDNSR